MRASGFLFCVFTASLLTAWNALARDGQPPSANTPDETRSQPPEAPPPAKSQPAESQPAESQPAEPQPGGAQPAQSQPVEPQPVASELPLDDLYRNSISCGSANRGSLRSAAELPRSGRGYEIPEPWWSRDRRFGTDELVGVIKRAAAHVADKHPGAMLGVADLSQERGGAISSHRSHQSGRDADLIFYALDAQGQPFRPDNHMAYYSRSGRAHYAKAPKYDRTITERFFDLPRNWALVRMLMTDQHVTVDHMFVSRRIRRWLLKYAEKIGEDPELIKRASRILKRPASTGGHNDHMHIRVRCTSDDITIGRCKNSIARGRRKFYSRIRCPAKPRQPRQIDDSDGAKQSPRKKSKATPPKTRTRKPTPEPTTPEPTTPEPTTPEPAETPATAPAPPTQTSDATPAPTPPP